MKSHAFESVPPLSAGCRTIVAIPARNEAALIEATLLAFATQRSVDESSLRPASFEILVLVNGSSDDTAARAKAVGRRSVAFPIHVVESDDPAVAANVGTARGAAMDFAAHRLVRAGLRDGIVASVDADTLVDDVWIATLERELRDVDAAAGFVTLGERDLAEMLAPARLLYDRERAFRRIVASTEDALDPQPEDPMPRHASFVGAAFGVRAHVYLAAGGIPPLARLEDRAFEDALRRIDARIRHSVRLRATTSARVRPRVAGGFGTFVADIVERGRRRDTFYVEPAAYWLDRFAARAVVRRAWRDIALPEDDRTVTRAFALPPEAWRSLVDRTLPFGTIFDRVVRIAERSGRSYESVPVEDAIAALRAASASRNAATPIRTSAASGAG